LSFIAPDLLLAIKRAVDRRRGRPASLPTGLTDLLFMRTVSEHSRAARGISRCGR
jgi:hypothetical protein